MRNDYEGGDEGAAPTSAEARSPCAGCGLPPPHCACDLLPRLQTRTRVLIIRHNRERGKPSSTGGLLARALVGSVLVDVGAREPTDLSALGPLLAAPGAVVLSPSGRARLEDVHTLVLLDGTWPQVRRMYRRVPGVAGLPGLALPPPDPRRMRLRVPTVDGGMATLEAAAAALELLEGPDVAAPLYTLFDAFTDRQRRMRGR